MRAWLIAAGVMLMSGPAWAEPDPIAIMKKMNETVGAWPSLRADIRRESVGVMSTRTPMVAATVQAQRITGAKEPGTPAVKFIATGKATAPGKAEAPFGASYDGAKFRVLKPADRVMKESGPSGGRDLLKGDGDLAVAWLLRWDEFASRPLENPDETGEVRYEGQVAVNGVMCDVVYVDFSGFEGMEEMDAWWYIGAADSLPRRLERHFSEANGDGFDVLTFTKIERADPTDSTPYALAAPEGYKTDVVTEPEKPEGAGRIARPAALPVGSPAPDWALEDPAGKTHHLSDYKGKVVVMDFWATWCGPCKAAMPGMQTLHEKLSDRGVNVFGINCWEQGDPAAYMAEQKLSYGLLLKGDDVAKTYGVSGIPTFYVIGTDGRIIYTAVGYNPSGEETLEKIIVEHLKAGGK